MEIIKNGIVFSNDIELILKGNNALKFNYEKNGLIIPNSKFIEDLRNEFKKVSISTYGNNITVVDEEKMIYYMNKFINQYKDYFPIVSMDEIYINCDNKNIFSLDCTRMTGQKELISRLNPHNKDSVRKQIKNLTDKFKKDKINQIILADDVVFSGSVISQISELFEENGINIVGVIAAISTEDAYELFNNKLLFGLKCGYLMKKDVIDEICERDFYFGIAQSGMSKMENGRIYKAPYFLPYGDPVARASVPNDQAVKFSNECVRLSLELWKEIEKRSKKDIFIKDLPEPILNTNEEENVVKTLRKVLK